MSLNLSFLPLDASVYYPSSLLVAAPVLPFIFSLSGQPELHTLRKRASTLDPVPVLDEDLKVSFLDFPSSTLQLDSFRKVCQQSGDRFVAISPCEGHHTL